MANLAPNNLKKTVLCVFMDRRRPVTFSSDTDGKTERQNLLEAVKATFSDILSTGEGSSSTGSYFLQTESSEWGGALVDITEDVIVEDHGTVHLRCSTNDERKESSVSTAKSVLSKVSKPTGSVAKSLSKLFPSFSGSGFDPRSECTSTSSHLKKKKFIPNYSCVDVVMLKNFQLLIPKGDLRKELVKAGRIKKVQLSRRMTQQEVKMKILEAFQCDGFSLLECVKGRLCRADNVELTGTQAISRRGALYLCQDQKKKLVESSQAVEPPVSKKAKVRESDSDSDFEVKPGSSVCASMRMLKKSKQLKGKSTPPTTSCDSDDEYEMLSPQPKDGPQYRESSEVDEHSIQSTLRRADAFLGSVRRPVIVPSSPSNSGDESRVDVDYLVESRRLRQQQDEAYAESLKIDREKEERRQKKEQLDQAREVFQLKWSNVVSANTNSMLVLLPDSTRIVCSLPETASPKDLYEFIFAKSSLSHPFRIYTRIGHNPINASSEGTLSGVMNAVLIVEELTGTESDLLEFIKKEANITVNTPTPQAEAAVDEENLNDQSVAVRQQEHIRRKQYMQSLGCEEGSPHLIRRDELYNDVIMLYTDFQRLADEFPFRVAFDDEQALDTGGVSRDLFSAFWNIACQKHFDGSGTLIPAIHPHMDMQVFPLLGCILSHGYLACGFLPVQVAFPILSCVLLGPNMKIQDDVLIQSFIEHVNICDSTLLKACYQEVNSGSRCFSPAVLSDLITMLSKFSCRQMPSPLNFKSILADIARHEFLVKPLGALYSLNGGIPDSHRKFWSEVTIERFLCVYYALHATPAKVLKVIKEPEFMNPSQSLVFGYLRQFIGNMKVDEVRSFLRFVTGSSALVVKEINVGFNTLSGLNRRPIAHTCASSIQLSTSYTTCVEFCEEFQAVLTNEYSWIMDSV